MTQANVAGADEPKAAYHFQPSCGPAAQHDVGHAQGDFSVELKDFVKQTLEQIVEGVSMAQESVASKGGTINPSKMRFYEDGKWNNYQHAMPRLVEFDVGLTSTDKKGSSEGIGVFLGTINLGKKSDTGVENIAVTRVRFSVPVVLPPGASLLE